MGITVALVLVIEIFVERQIVKFFLLFLGFFAQNVSVFQVFVQRTLAQKVAAFH